MSCANLEADRTQLCPDLSVLTVDPDVHRSGAGSALLQWGCKQADRDGVDIYLEATDVGVPLYERHGFHHILEPIVGGPYGEMVVYPMRRPALKVELVTARDVIPILATLHREAFVSTRWYQALWGQVEPDQFERWMRTEIKSWFDRGQQDGTEHLVVAKRGDDIIGYAHWQLVDNSGHSEKTTLVAPQTCPAGTNESVWQAFGRDMDKWVDSIPGKFWRECHV